MYEKIFKKFDVLYAWLCDRYTEVQLVLGGSSTGYIVLVEQFPNKPVKHNVLATFDSLGHLHHILTLFLEHSYDNIIYHEIDEQLERQERERVPTLV